MLRYSHRIEEAFRHSDSLHKNQQRSLSRGQLHYFMSVSNDQIFSNVDFSKHLLVFQIRAT